MDDVRDERGRELASRLTEATRGTTDPREWTREWDNLTAHLDTQERELRAARAEIERLRGRLEPVGELVVEPDADGWNVVDYYALDNGRYQVDWDVTQLPPGRYQIIRPDTD